MTRSSEDISIIEALKYNVEEKQKIIDNLLDQLSIVELENKQLRHENELIKALAQDND